MTAATRNERQLRQAKTTVGGWFALAEPGSAYKCESGGYLINIGEEFPAWRHNVQAARQLLLECGISPAALDALP